MQKIAILGSTGSIGTQTLEVAESLGAQITALTAHTQVNLIEQQARRYHPGLVVMTDESAARELAVRLSDTDIKIYGGCGALEEAAALPNTDIVVTAVVGMVGLKPTLAAIRAGKRVALANKETLVCGGELVMKMAERFHSEIIPVDSEHSAIFQCLQGCHAQEEVRRLILTCSGGPFYGMDARELASKTVDDALQHPNWSMGAKITTDCATLMNKGLEVIEAMRLYQMPLENISVLIHRQSVIHSMVEYQDGVVLAQLGTPDMRTPIRYAFTFPRRGESHAEPLNFLTCPPLTFAEPDRKVFPCLALAEEAAAEGGTACTVLNAANEEAVRLFLARKIAFPDIPEIVASVRAKIPVMQNPSLPEILEADQMAREAVRFERQMV